MFNDILKNIQLRKECGEYVTIMWEIAAILYEANKNSDEEFDIKRASDNMLAALSNLRHIDPIAWMQLCWKHRDFINEMKRALSK